MTLLVQAHIKGAIDANASRLRLWILGNSTQKSSQVLSLLVVPTQRRRRLPLLHTLKYQYVAHHTQTPSRHDLMLRLEHLEECLVKL
jgi:hypothetical protein